MKTVCLKTLSKWNYFIMREGMILYRWKSYLPKLLWFFPDICISSAHQHSRRKEYTTKMLYLDGICYGTNPGLPCLLSSKEPELLTIIIYLFRLWSWYTDWGAKAQPMNEESPTYSGRFKLERCKIFACSMFHMIYSKIQCFTIRKQN